MKRLGLALHVVQKKLIVRVDPVDEGSRPKLPRVNSVVVNHKRVKIGNVIDIFGPVKRPYVAIKPFRGIDAGTQIGKKLYFEER